MQSPGSYTSQQNPHPRQPQQLTFGSAGVAYPPYQAQSGYPGYYPPYPSAPRPSQVARPVGYVHHSVSVERQYVAPVFESPQTPYPVSWNPGQYQPSMQKSGVVLDASGYPAGSPPPPQTPGYPSPYLSSPGISHVQTHRQVSQSPQGGYSPHPTQVSNARPSGQNPYQPRRCDPPYPVQSPQMGSPCQQYPVAGSRGYGGIDVGPAHSSGAHPTTSQQYSGVLPTPGHGTTVTILSRSGKPPYVQTFPPGETVTIVMPPRDSSRHKSREHKSRDRKDRHSKQ